MGTASSLKCSPQRAGLCKACRALQVRSCGCPLQQLVLENCKCVVYTLLVSRPRRALVAQRSSHCSRPGTARHIRPSLCGELLCSDLLKQCCCCLPLQEGMKPCMAASLPAWASGHGTAAARRQLPCFSRGPWLLIKAPIGLSVWGRPSQWLLLRSMLPAGQLACRCML